MPQVWDEGVTFRQGHQNSITIPIYEPELHWKLGLSAMSAAACWEENELRLPSEITNVLEASGDKLLTSLEMLIAIPEWEVDLPGGAKISRRLQTRSAASV